MRDIFTQQLTKITINLPSSYKRTKHILADGINLNTLSRGLSSREIDMACQINWFLGFNQGVGEFPVRDKISKILVSTRG